jgi:hypothetical protein
VSARHPSPGRCRGGTGIRPSPDPGGIGSGVIKIIPGKLKDIDRLIGKEIDALLRDGFARSDIAILSLRGLNYPENIVHQIWIGGEAFCKASDEICSNEIIGDTFLRFKGLERLAVIITDLRHVEDWLETRLLIALTRATSVVRIVDDEKALRKIHAFARYI